VIDDPLLAPPLDPVADSVSSPAVTASDLAAAGIAPAQIATFLAPFNASCVEFSINTPVRVACFLAQTSWESSEFRRLAEIWGPTPAQAAYPGGRQWSGHGLIQVTGRANHLDQADHFGIDESEIAAWLQTPEGACRSAGYFWESHGCNELADVGNMSAITKRINGGYNGLPQRMAIFKSVATEMGLPI